MNVRNHRFFDGALAACAATALVVEGLLRSGHWLPALAYPLSAAAAAPLAFRRRTPLAVLFGVVVAAIACVAVFKPGMSALFLVIAALFNVALVGDRQRSLLAGALTGAALIATLLFLGGDMELSTATVYVLLLLAAPVVGDTVRSRRILRAVALERAVREAREREEEHRQGLISERLRIARDLHDTLAHALVAINVRAGVAAHLRERQDPEAALLDIKEVSANALRDLRLTLRLLREQDDVAPELPALDLDALPELFDRVRAAGLDTRVEVADSAAAAVPSPVGQAAFRIVQEALTNIMRHAHASRAQVLVEVSDESLRIQVTDNGPGRTEAVSGHGLRGMAERVAALNGRLVAGPRTEGGWQVLADLPLSLREDVGAS
jgi:signal transduction histidine kinase